jgi:hypothetical protein
VSAVVLTVQLWSGMVYGQAWVPARGEGAVSLTYQNYDVVGHFDVQGRKNNNGGTQSHVIVAELDFGLTDTTAFIVSVPFIGSKYTGAPVYFVGGRETHPGPLDDGTYHGALQDLRVEIRRLLWVGPAAVTPFVGASFPTHDYETVGEAVPGRHRRDVQFGANAGIDLARILPGSYLHGRYAYAIAERTNGFPFTRSNIDVEGGYAVTSALTVRGIVNRQIRHRGPSLAELTPDWEHHDRFIAPSYLNVGGGASVAITGTTDVYALWLSTVSGNNGAHRARTLACGITISLGSGLHGFSSATAAARQPTRALDRLKERFP